MDRISSLDQGYKTGDLSIYPAGIDTVDTLYSVKNNASTVLTHGLTYNSNFIVVSDATGFPSAGLLTVGTELIYYANRTNSLFQNLKRGFAGSRQNQWSTGTIVSNTVQAETHNALKDAIINVEKYMGLKDFPGSSSLNGILSNLETNFLAPKPKFRAFPILGAPPFKVHFQNFSGGPPIRFLWDFGDNTTSLDINPTHIYQNEGIYTVKLSMITILGAQGVVTKKDYITVDANSKLPLFYVDRMSGVSQVTSFNFVDQTDGDIVNRYWIWDDNTQTVVDDPDVHTATHVYQQAGLYSPTLLVVFSDTSLKRVQLDSTIVVT